jgi:hypothetical protein
MTGDNDGFLTGYGTFLIDQVVGHWISVAHPHNHLFPFSTLNPNNPRQVLLSLNHLH